jgi:hypothetical protein
VRALSDPSLRERATREAREKDMDRLALFTALLKTRISEFEKQYEGDDAAHDYDRGRRRALLDVHGDLETAMSMQTSGVSEPLIKVEGLVLMLEDTFDVLTDPELPGGALDTKVAAQRAVMRLVDLGLIDRARLEF